MPDSPTCVKQTLTGSLRGPASFTIDPATVGDNTGTLVVAGNLQVDGTTTTVNSTTLTVDDKNIELAHSPSGSVGNDAAIDGGGITLKSSAGDKTILFNDTFNSWDFNQNLNMPSVSGTLMINNTAILNKTTLATTVVNSSLTSVGTIGTGTWEGSAIQDAYIASSATWNAKATLDDAVAMAIALG